MHKWRGLRWVPVAIVLLAACGCGRRPRRGSPGVDDELGPADGAIEAPLLIRGKVAAVDRRNGVVFVNVGERHGVRERYGLTVCRDGKPIARAVVLEVFPDLCAARVGRSTRAAVQVGDDVTTRVVARRKRQE